MSVIKILGFIALVPLAIVFMQFGTISPCGMLRENIKQHDKLAAHLPNGLIEAGMSMQYGDLSPSRCIALLAGSNNTGARVLRSRDGVWVYRISHRFLLSRVVEVKIDTKNPLFGKQRT